MSDPREEQELVARIARIDERTENTQRAIGRVQDMLQNQYVTKDEFRPIKLLVYGAVATALTAIGGAMIALIIK